MPNTGKQIFVPSRGMSRSRGRRLNFKQVKQVTRLINKNKRVKQRWILQDHMLQPDPGALFEFTVIPKGVDHSERDSDKLAALSLQLHLSINQNDSDNEIDDEYRFFLVRSKSGPLTVTDMPLFFGRPNLDKYQVYLDKYINIKNDTVEPIEIDFYKSFKTGKVPHMIIGYDGVLDGTNAINNGIYLFVIKREAGVLTGGTMIGYSLLKYVDLD